VTRLPVTGLASNCEQLNATAAKTNSQRNLAPAGASLILAFINLLPGESCAKLRMKRPHEQKWTPSCKTVFAVNQVKGGAAEWR
jgi:hypothetical protein